MTIYWRPSLARNLLAALFFTVTSLASLAGSQSLQSIADAAVDESKKSAQRAGFNSVKVSLRPLDNRLQLPACDKPLNTFLPPPADRVLGALSIGVRCAGQKPWTIYVRANVEAQQQVPTLAMPMPRNKLISEADVIMTSMAIHSSNQNIITHPQQIIGMETTRSIQAGVPVRISDLRAPKVIKRGQIVTLISKMNNLEVKGQGKALHDAIAGERLAATNLSSGKKITGIANTNGTVDVQ